jgi:hypothetical protein
MVVSLVRKGPQRRRIYRKRVIGTVEDYRDEAAVRKAASGLLSEVNMRSRHDRIGSISIDQLCEHFEQREMRSGTSLWSIATQKTYRGYIRRWIRPRWGVSLSGWDQGSGSGGMAARAKSCARLAGRVAHSREAATPDVFRFPAGD